MNRGGKIIGAVATLSVAACGGEQGKLEIRPIKAPLAAGVRAVPFRIAEARGQFALGNIALALESFRLALREDPNSIDAMTGVAACYDQMARFDLSRRHYEAALAIAPGDPQLLTAFAGSLDLQGKSTEAASVRQEIKQRIALAAQDAAHQPAPVAVLAAAPKPKVSVPPKTLPAVPMASRAEPVQQIATVDRPAPARAMAVVQAKPVQIAQVEQITLPAPTDRQANGRSVTIKLPPARPVAVSLPATARVEPAKAVALLNPLPIAPQAVALAPTARTLPLTQPSPVTPSPSQPALVIHSSPAVLPVPIAANPDVIVARAERDVAKTPGQMKAGPRIERLSLREVELITVPGPRWRPVTIAHTQQSATVRFIPLRQAALRYSGVRVLNAARVDKLAARTRLYLAGRGWRAISIGDAAAVRMRSVILYPADKRRTAERLSAQFGFAIAHRPGARQVTILLGRDAARDSALRARS